MYSVLIPTYNYDVTLLVQELHRQALELMADFEIIVLDDGSGKYTEENSRLSNLSNCSYIALEKNVGRAAARNRLAGEARFPYLIFIDCDAAVQHDDYLRRYANFFKDEDVVVIGGTAYDESVKNPRFSLRLTYGRKREANSLYHHHNSSFDNFSTFNFLISKSVFLNVSFDESIKGYGHEDTLFGHALHEAGYAFFRIDNSLIHIGLDDNRTFLRKTEESVANLYRLYKSGKYPFLETESRLLSAYTNIKGKNMNRLLAFAGYLLQPFMKWQLCSSRPSLRIFDFYKLTFLCRFAENG